ncbi:MAG: hypothetical protein CW716_04985 [Candidatus Bathyarchaeum sp.]|nr:MAG: hypothetical protein CW716_04985 [Candidatus Bathyarchaeum sp.]
MQRPKLSTFELVFVLVAASILFTITFYEMSTAGILPGNDPAVHLVKSATIVINQRVSYSAVPWYPPLFHAVVATLQMLAGTLDVVASAFMIKLLISTFYVLILLSTYLICRKLFGIGVAVASALFTVVSLPLVEMVFWGGYANFMGLAYIAFIFYVILKDIHDIKQMLLLFVVAFTIVMSHQLATFVFVLLFVPIFLINVLRGSKRKTLVYLAVVVGGGLAILAWYAQMVIEYSSMIIEHLFFAMTENIYVIPEVQIETMIRDKFGATLVLALVAIPITVFWLKKKQNLKATILLFSWFAIPFVLSQSYLFGLYLPYDRFMYFFATPIVILTAILTFSLTRIPDLAERYVPKIKNKLTVVRATKVLALILIASLFVVQAQYFVERTEVFPEYYEWATPQSYSTGLWIQEHAPLEGNIVSSRRPGSWLNVLSYHHTIEETNPLYSRNAVAESVVYGFYEAENSKTLLREYKQVPADAGQEIHVQLNNLWKSGMSLPNDGASLIYVDDSGRWITIPLNSTEISVYWKTQTESEAQLVTEYKHELFTATKIATLLGNSSVVKVNWAVQTNEALPQVKLSISHTFDPLFNFTEGIAPGILEWQNTFEEATRIHPSGVWGVLETTYSNLEGNTIAYYAPEDQALAIVEFDEPADWLIFGVLDTMFMDILRVRYELGSINLGQSQEISYSVLLCSTEGTDVKQIEPSEFIQQYDQTLDSTVQTIDFLTNIEEYDIKFVVVDTEKLPEQLFQVAEPTPDLDRIYDNGRTVTYTTKR